jgi:hypothetical protein
MAPTQTRIYRLVEPATNSAPAKPASAEGKPKFMDLETAKTSVDFLLAESGDRRSIHITFCGELGALGAATTKVVTEIRVIPIFTIAIGFGIGQILVSQSMEPQLAEN